MNGPASVLGVDRRRRAVELLITIPGTVAAVPLLVGTALTIRLQMGRPILFSQERAGRDGVPFTLYKFRTMSVADSAEFLPATDGTRITQLGRTLRRLSLDELPQLWNVLRGEMALVGPRPLPVIYVDRYTALQRRRLEVRPGITGLAQVSGRNAISWDEKFELDVDYVDSRSVRLDVSILWRTVRTIVRRDGISAEGQATMIEFHGSGVTA